MIKAERERVAYCRIPANELLYCEDENERGVNCGKTIDVNLKVGIDQFTLANFLVI